MSHLGISAFSSNIHLRGDCLLCLGWTSPSLCQPFISLFACSCICRKHKINSDWLEQAHNSLGHAAPLFCPFLWKLVLVAGLSCILLLYLHVCVCAACHLQHCSALCITPGINQSSLLVICRLHFPACRGAKCLCKPLWEINTINTARFNSPQGHNIFKYLSTVLPPSSPISLSCLCSFCCFSLLFRCTTIPLFDIFCFSRPLFVSYLCLALSSFSSSWQIFSPLPISLLTGDTIIPHSLAGL